MSSNDIINATSSSSGTIAVDDISNDIGRIRISNDNGDVSESNMSGKRSEETSSKKCTSCEQNLEHIKTNNVSHDNVGIDIVSGDIGNDIDDKEICANCGKEGATNSCNKCKMVNYCNAACKKKHRKKHKKECDKRVAELQEEENRRAAELRNIELFKQPPPQHGDCPICFLLLPFHDTGRRYKSCCGKMICSGCVYAVLRRTKKTAIPLCPFCRTPTPTTDKKYIEMIKTRVDASDAIAMNSLGSYYSNGSHGLSQDHTKALELYHQAAGLGYAEAYCSIGYAYQHSRGVGCDEKKAVRFYELAAMGGDSHARHNLGAFEASEGNLKRAAKHWLISAEGGHVGALKNVKLLYLGGEYVTKDDYTTALRAYQKYLNEVKSPQRDEAAAAREEYKYIG